MGLKRSFESGEFQELPFKNMKCVESSDKLASLGEIIPGKDVPNELNISGKLLLCFFPSLMPMPHFVDFLN